MTPLPPASPTPATAFETGGLLGHPRGLSTLFFTEMWERFSYYGMRALLVLFMTTAATSGGLGFTDKASTNIYGTYTMSVYLLSILGGFIADNFIGSRRAVLWGGTIIACGHYSMAIHSTSTFFFGLFLVAIGTGLLKPNISTMVGSLYSPTDERRDAGFSIFYMGINLGALTSSFVCGWLAQSDTYKNILKSWGLDPLQSWHWAFGAAGVGMTLGLVTYLLRRNTLAQVGNAPAVPVEGRPWGKLILVALTSYALIKLMWLGDEHRWIIVLLFVVEIAAVPAFAFRKNKDSQRIAAILLFFIAAQIFFAIFEQAGSSMSLFADRLTDNRMFGIGFPSAFWQSVNAAWVIVLALPFAFLWTKLGHRQPSSPFKFTLGLFFVAISFVWMIPAARLTANGIVSPVWLLGLYFLQTVGEMFLSPVGLSTMTKLAPPRLLGLVMGIWFLAAALGNKLAGVLAGDFKSDDPTSLVTFFWHQALWVGGATLALFLLVPWLRKLMGGVR